MRKFSIIFTVFIIGVIFYSCTDKFDAPDNTVDPDDQYIISDTVYVQQNPVWEGFNKPQDIIVGREPFLYVADTDNDRIVMMNIAGEVLGVRNIKRPIALAQDYKLNLIVCAQFDTVINNINTTYSAVYKMNIVDVNHQIEQAQLKRLLPKTSFDFLRTDREYTGVCVFHDNFFYVARRGPANSNPVDPDNGIFIFEQRRRPSGTVVDTLVGRIPLVEPIGTGLLSVNRVSSLTSFGNGSLDFIVTLIGENSFKTQWLRFISNSDFTGYQNYLEPFFTDIMTVDKFGQPEDVALDERNNIFVADAEKDSVFKFNSFGDELESFGGPEVFNGPHAVAFFDRTLYVADTDNNRILRFILSTDID